MKRRRLLGIFGSATIGIAGCLTSDERTPPAESDDDGGSGEREVIEPVDCTGTTLEPAADQWPTYKFDERNTGYRSDGEPIRTEPEEQWAIDDVMLRCSPVADDDVVYVSGIADGPTVDIYAIEGDTGEFKWTQPTGLAADEIEGDPFPTDVNRSGTGQIHDGTLYIGGGNTDSVDVGDEYPEYETVADTRSLYALDLDTGEVSWQYLIEADMDGGVSFSDETLYFGDNTGTVHAVDASTGDLRWRADTALDQERSPGVEGPPAVSDCVVYVGTNQGNMHALAAEDGEELWRVEGDGNVIRSPTVDDGLVFFGFDAIQAYDTEEQTEVWSVELGDSAASTVSVTDDRAYVSAGPTFHCLDKWTGDSLWSHEDATGSDMRADPVIVDDVVYASTGTEGTVRAFDTVDGDILWSRHVGGTLFEPFCLVDGRLYVPRRDGGIAALAP